MNFWLLFLGANFVFFLVPYFVNIKEDPNPLRFFFDKDVTLGSKLLFPYTKLSSDPFKLNFDFSIFILIALLVNWSGLAANIVGALIGLFTWVVITYYAVIIYIMGRKPIIRSDYELALFGLDLAKNKLLFVWAAVLLAMALMFVVSFQFTSALLSYAPSTAELGVALLGLLVLGLYKFKTSGYNGFHLRTVLSSTIYLWRNVRYSEKYNFIASQDEQFFESFNYYQKVQLAQKPNVNIFCVESYGSVVYKDPEFSDVKDYVASFNAQLKAKGLFVASALSTPPLFAGGSWKSYTSLNYGTRIEDDTQYALMFKDSKGFGKYQSIFHLLKNQGYKNILLAGLGKEIDEKFDWSLLKNNFQYDDFYEWKHLEYKGKEIKFYGVRDCPPDQFTLNKGFEIIDREVADPQCLFFISLNSHYPYKSPTECLDSWQALDDPNAKFDVNDQETNVKARYHSAIKYQMQNFLSFIEQRKGKNEIFIMFGDHQPPLVAKKSDGWETPIHVITKNKELLAPFYAEGYVDGLVPETNGSRQFLHEGFLSLFMNGLNKGFGLKADLDLPYRPNGAVFNSKTQ